MANQGTIYSPDQIELYLSKMRNTDQGEKYKEDEWQKYADYVRKFHLPSRSPASESGRPAPEVGAPSDLAGLDTATNYLSNLVNTGVGSIAAGTKDALRKLVGMKDAAYPYEELGKRALMGKHNPTGEMLDRIGIPEMGRISTKIPIPSVDFRGENGPEYKTKELPVDFTTRDALALAASAKLDPLNRLATSTAAANPDALASKLLSPIKNTVGAGVNKLGEVLHDSAFKNVQQKINSTFTKPGKPIGQVTREQGVWGTAKSIQNQLKKLLSDSGKEAETLFDKNVKGTIDPAVAYTPAIDAAEKMHKERPLTRTGVDSFTDDLMTMLSEPQPDPKVFKQWNTDFGKRAEGTPSSPSPSKIFKGFSPQRELDAEAQHAGMRHMLDLVEQASPADAARARELNANMTAMYRARKALVGEAGAETRRNHWTPVDTMAAMFTAMTHPAEAMKHMTKMVLAKKTTDAAKSFLGRTATARGLMNVGQSSLWDEMARRRLMDSEAK